MGQADMMYDTHSARALKIAQMTALSALTDLHMALAPTVVDSRKSAVEAITQIVHMTSTFGEDDYIRLDPVLCVRVCLSTLLFSLLRP